MKYYWIFFTFLFVAPSAWATSQDPDCGGDNDSYPAAITFTHLKNEGLIDNYNVDFSKTTAVKLVSQKIRKEPPNPYGQEDIYRQAYDIKFTKKSGEVVEAITLIDATSKECSEGYVDIFIVSQHVDGCRMATNKTICQANAKDAKEHW